MWTACRVAQGQILEWGGENLLKSGAGLVVGVDEGGVQSANSAGLSKSGVYVGS